MNIEKRRHILLLKSEKYKVVKRLYSIISLNNFKIWMAASSVDNFYYVLHSESKRLTKNREISIDEVETIDDLFNRFMEEVSVFSVEPKTVRKALSGNNKDIEDNIIW